MNCILDLNFDILNKINDEVIKKRKRMKYLDDKELKSKCEPRMWGSTALEHLASNHGEHGDRWEQQC